MFLGGGVGLEQDLFGQRPTNVVQLQLARAFCRSVGSRGMSGSTSNRFGPCQRYVNG